MPLKHLSWGPLWEAASSLDFLEDFQTKALLIHALPYSARGRFLMVLLTQEGGSRPGPWWHSEFRAQDSEGRACPKSDSVADGLLSVLTLGPRFRPEDARLGFLPRAGRWVLTVAEALCGAYCVHSVF